MENLIKFVPEQLLIVVAALFILGVYLKRTPKVEDWCIPWILTLIGIIGSIAIMVIGNSISIPVIATGIFQGIICSGCAVLVNQLSKQSTIKRIEDITVKTMEDKEEQQ
ncbi:MAG: phage holin family protein [Clostridium celatum]|nr:phage holin family protein [Clostridium celatum]